MLLVCATRVGCVVYHVSVRRVNGHEYMISIRNFVVVGRGVGVASDAHTTVDITDVLIMYMFVFLLRFRRRCCTTCQQHDQIQHNQNT